MQCARCSGLVIWKGPISALTHTKCQRCGAINSQVPEEQEEEDEEDNVEH